MGAATLPLDADFTEVDDLRRADRRAADRRAGKRRFDPLFAATLVNHVAPPEAPCARGYARTQPSMWAGVVVNLRA